MKQFPGGQNDKGGGGGGGKMIWGQNDGTGMGKQCTLKDFQGVK